MCHVFGKTNIVMAFSEQFISYVKVQSLILKKLPVKIRSHFSGCDDLLQTASIH